MSKLSKLSHTNTKGEARMVDIGAKDLQPRMAVAGCRIELQPGTVALIKENQIKKGDVLAAARIAGITAAKKTYELIPLCHNIHIDRIDVDIDLLDDGAQITATASCRARTGIEMEALTAVSVTALTVYDMCKAVDKTMSINGIKLLRKVKGEF